MIGLRLAIEVASTQRASTGSAEGPNFPSSQARTLELRRLGKVPKSGLVSLGLSPAALPSCAALAHLTSFYSRSFRVCLIVVSLFLCVAPPWLPLSGVPQLRSFQDFRPSALARSRSLFITSHSPFPRTLTPSVRSRQLSADNG
jgi:hypothetical protein